MIKLYKSTQYLYQHIDKRYFKKCNLNKYGLSLIQNDKHFLQKLLNKEVLVGDEQLYVYHLVKQMFLSNKFTSNTTVYTYITDLIRKFSSKNIDNIALVVKLLSLHKSKVEIIKKETDLHNLSYVELIIIGSVLKEYNLFVQNKRENIGIYYYLIILTLGLIRNKYRKNNWKVHFVSTFNTELLKGIKNVKYDNIRTAQIYFDTKSFGINSDITNFQLSNNKKIILNNFFKKSNIIKHEVLNNHQLYNDTTIKKGRKRVYISLYNNILKNLHISRKQFRTFSTMLLDIDNNFSFVYEFNNKNIKHLLANKQSKTNNFILKQYMKLYQHYTNDIKINFALLKEDFFKYIDELWEHNKIKEFDKYNDIVYFIDTLTKNYVNYKVGKNGRIFTVGNTFWNINKKVLSRYLNYKDQQLYEVDLHGSIVNIIRYNLGLSFNTDNYGVKFRNETKQFIMYLLNGRKRDLTKLMKTLHYKNNSLRKIFKAINSDLHIKDIKYIINFILHKHPYINDISNMYKKDKNKLIYKYLKEEVNLIVSTLLEFKQIKTDKAFIYKFDGIYLFNKQDAMLFSSLLEKISIKQYGAIFPYKVEMK